MHTVALRESEVTDLITEGLSFHMCAETSIMRFNSSVLQTDSIAYTRYFMCPYR